MVQKQVKILRMIIILRICFQISLPCYSDYQLLLVHGIPQFATSFVSRLDTDRTNDFVLRLTLARFVGAGQQLHVLITR